MMGVMVRFLVGRVVITAIALVLASLIISGVDITGGLINLLGVTVLFGLVTAFLGPILKLISLPLTVITLGLFTLVVNGVLLAIVAGLSSHLQVGGFVSTILAALLITIFTAIGDATVGRAFFDRSRGGRRRA